jgi:hypothetical protein
MTINELFIFIYLPKARTTHNLIRHCEENDLEVDAEKIKLVYMLMSCEWTVGQNHNTEMANTTLAGVGKSRYLAKTVINEHRINEEIKSR